MAAMRGGPIERHVTTRDDSRAPWRIRWLCSCGWASRWGDSGAAGPGLDLIRHTLETLDTRRPAGE